MSKTRWLACLLAAALPLAAGCNTSSQAASGSDDSSKQIDPLRAKTMVTGAVTGHQVGPEGIISQDQQGKNFSAGQTIYVALRLKDAPTGATVRADWFNEQGQQVGSTEKKVLRGEPAMSFASPDTTAWPLGTYRVEISIGDQKADTESFAVAAPESSSPLSASPGKG